MCSLVSNIKVWHNWNGSEIGNILTVTLNNRGHDFRAT